MNSQRDYDLLVLGSGPAGQRAAVQAAKLGAHVATLPPKILRQLYDHPLTDKGLAAFLADWAKTGQSIL
jgi:transaldolase